MVNVTTHRGIGQALDLLAGVLEVFIDRATAATLPPGIDWRAVLAESDQGTERTGDANVVQWLRVLIEPVGDYGYLCENDLTMAGQRLASQALEIASRWSAGEPFDAQQAATALETIGSLLRALGAPADADAVAQISFHEPDAPMRVAVPTATDAPAEPVAAEEGGEPATCAELPPDAEPHPPEGISIEISATDVLSYAVAHNRVPVIRQLTIRDVDAPIRGATLEIELRDADGAIGSPMERIVDLEPGHETVLTSIGFVLDPEAMLQLEEQRPGKLIVRLKREDATVAERSASVDLLAANQWLAKPLSLGLEMLAAFVMPNHPAITTLMSDVADRLGKTTGSPSIQGYQAGPERVDEIVAAIFTVMHERGIRYSEPPASWADIGQKVRTPGEVLEGRIGTCLDTVVVMAAALEQAGIRPLLWVVEGHAFLGYWRDERSLDAAARMDAGDIVNLIDLGLIGLIETTLLTGQGPAASLAEVHLEPYRRWLSGHFEQVLGVTDIYRARRDGILPLPARRRMEDGSVVVTEYRPVVTQSAPVAASAAAPVAPRGERQRRAPAPPRVAQWKNALLDLSLRNRLINFTDNARIELTVPASYLARFEDEVNQGTPFQLLPSDRIAAVHQERGLRYGRELPEDQLNELLVERRQVFSDITEGSYLRKMRNLAYSARTLVEETGANNLYLAFGSLVWSVEGRALRSPLILVPVQLNPVSRQGFYRLTLDESGASTPNYCLLEKLRQLHGLEIPELETPVDDAAGIDLDQALQAARLAIARQGLPYRVEPTADLAILQFAKFRLWKDLDENWETFSDNSLVQHLIQTPTEPFIDPVPAAEAVDLDELAAQSPMPADSSQLAAVAEAVAGRTFVLEGPPGTGKSQTITNLLTRAIVDGKRVLFVAEKRAALDVVQKRLEDVGLGPFCLDLHDKSSRPNEVRTQIRQALEHTVEVDSQGMAADFDLLSASRGALVRYTRRLHEQNAAGLSYYTARTSELAMGTDVPAFPVPEAFARDAAPDVVAQIRSVLTLLPDVADLARPGRRHPWAFVDVRDRSVLDLSASRAAALELDTAFDALPRSGPIAEVLKSARMPEDLAILDAFLSARQLSLSTLDAVRSPDWQQASDTIVRDIAAFAGSQQPRLDSVTPAVFDLPLGEIDQAARAAADSGFFGRKKRLEAVRDRLAGALRPGVSLDLKELPELTGGLVQVQAKIAELAARASALAGIALPAGWNPLTPEGRGIVEQQVQWLRWAGGAVDPANQGDREPFVLALRGFIGSYATLDTAASAVVSRACTAARALFAACHASSADVSAWSGETGLTGRWQETAMARRSDQEGLPTLRHWLDLLAHLEPLRQLRLHDGRAALLYGDVPADDAVRAFERGLAESSRSERAAATGLNAFDAGAHMRSISRFTGASAAVREHLLTAVPMQVIAARTFDVNAQAGQVGQLQRQLNRQRGGMGVRTLLNTFGELITQIMPCVLVSPDSVARFFPAQAGLFDIVVFDEASQIRVADAIGAMGRGKSVVVVGDSKQMPPTSFAEPTFTSDEVLETAFDTVEDEESILTECVQARVPRQWLSWHYRSQDESLIAFSNQQYYERKLSSFPAPVHGAADPRPNGHGISLVRVDGQFHRSGKGVLLRTNPIEAEAVVAEIRRRFDASPESAPSIGVVTFNIQQRNFIEALLRDSGDQRLIDALDEPDGLFVKNLENVQGDERDVIFFSTGFSINERGYLPLNFGPLNRSGGERRLNVAITRARRQVVVFSSFDPEQLRAEETSSVGIKHLRAYLDLAARGTDQLPQDARKRTVPDRHREEIANALRERGYVVKTDVGLSEFKIDLVVASEELPERPVMAVLLDGPSWAERRTVGDRDGLPVSVLSGMLRWPTVERVWMPAWLADREAVLASLGTAFAAALARADGEESPDGEPATQPAVHEDDLQHEPSMDLLLPGDGAAGGTDRSPESIPPFRSAQTPFVVAGNGAREHGKRVPLEEPFRAWEPRRLGSVEVLDQLPARRSSERVAEALREVVEAEGPVHFDRLVKLVAGGFGLGRVSESRGKAILRLLDPDLRADRREPFAWPQRLDPDAWRGYRPTPEGVDRPIEQISKREIVNAMAAICSASAGIDSEELKREALRVFGGRRMTANVTVNLTSAVELGLESGRLVLGSDGLVTAGS